ncbi:hypothetical protein [Pseudarthrobacter sp. AG30]|uniref:hypothetical protein n=1 Tax=Pseudarthrobacter sp. AG30 TaxID=2249742 RepID=UPI001403C794|nr:hypothetical protein [Pseudarthrobacter sp. AG30]
MITMTNASHQPKTVCKGTKRMPAKKTSGKEPKASYARSSLLLGVGSKSGSRMENLPSRDVGSLITRTVFDKAGRGDGQPVEGSCQADRKPILHWTPGNVPESVE